MDQETYLPLPLTLTREGHGLTQIERTPHAAIYRDDRGGFEVVRILRRREREFMGKVFPAQEVYPATSQWGELGWTYLAGDEAGARRRFEWLNAIATLPRPQKAKNAPPV
jgi:hypothetical protein